MDKAREAAEKIRTFTHSDCRCKGCTREVAELAEIIREVYYD